MKFDINIKSSEYTTGGFFSRKTQTQYRVHWNIILTEDEQKIMPLIQNTIVDVEQTTASTFGTLYDRSNDEARKMLDRPLRFGVDSFIGEGRGRSFDTPGEAREFENKLRYDIFPKIEALLFNNRPL